MQVAGAKSGVVLGRGRWKKRAVLAILLGATAIIWFKHDTIVDRVVLYNYQPPTAVAQLAADNTLTAAAKQLLYVNKPLLADKDEFNKHCSNFSDQVVVLGCFIGNRHGIFVYDVTDERLHGVEQVTIAHEMLHQAYQRLSSRERTKIDHLLNDYYAAHATDDLRSQMDSYRQTEPGQEADELHSLVGTEVGDLPIELAAYYKRYFIDQTKVVTFYNQYHSEFTKRRQQVAADDTQLALMKQAIDARKVDLTTRETNLSVQRAKLNAYLADSNIDAYNAGVPVYNAQVGAYKSVLASTNNLIDQYNTLLGQRNAIAIQEQELEGAINSHVSDAAKQ